MSRTKLKNIIILILLALNGFLLSVVVIDKNEARQVHRLAWEAMSSSLEERGVVPGDSLDSGIETPKTCVLRRNASAEMALAQKLLGTASLEELGGNIFFYTSDKGRGSLRGTGEADILFSPGAWSAGKDPGKSSLRLMRSLGLAYDEATVVVDENGAYSVCCVFDGLTVYNARLSFLYDGDDLLLLSGTRVFDDVSYESAEGVMDELTAMLRFLELLDKGDFQCSRLEKVEVGYLQSVTASGESTLDPVWHFTADTGELYISALTGRVEAL